MVTFGLGGALGNLLAGVIRDVTGSLELVYIIVTLTVILMALLTLIIIRKSPSKTSKLSLAV